ncbi:MAG: universal stress protein [Bacteroidota bacterium]
MRTILVPTDFSECASHALASACRIACRLDSEIILLHVISGAEGGLPVNGTGQWNETISSEQVPFMMKFLKETKRKMLRLASTPEFRSIRIKDVVETGDVVKTIRAASVKYGAQAIVMGTHGTKGLNDIFMGSTASRVVRDADIPVISIRDGSIRKISNIVFATDFSDEANLVFPFIRSFAEAFGANIHLLKILVDFDISGLNAEKRKGQQFEYENNISYPVQIIHHMRSKEEGIRRFAGMVGADLIAIGTHGRHGLARFFKGSLAEDVVNHAALPVLTVNFHRKLLEQQHRLDEETARAMREAAKGNTIYSMPQSSPIIT